MPRWLIRLKLFNVQPLVALLLLLLSSVDARAAANGGNRAAYHLLIGGRYLCHYNFEQVLSTPPPSGVLELQLGVRKGQAFELHLLVGRGLISATSLEVGAGALLPVFQGKALSAGLGFEAVYYSLRAPIGEETYEPASMMYRFGVFFRAQLGASRYFLDSNFYYTFFSNNVFITPFLGIGITF